MRAFLAVRYMALLIVLLITLHALVILFPEDAEWLSAVTSATFPWTILLMLFLIFYDSITSFLGNLKEVSAAGITVKVGQTGATLIDADGTLISHDFDELTKSNQASQKLARTYFLRFIYAVIYRSQYEFLEDLVNKGPSGRVIALVAYINFTSRKPKRLEATFGEWMAFLTTNSLVSVKEANIYEVTSLGKLFVTEVGATGIGASRFNY